MEDKRECENCGVPLEYYEDELCQDCQEEEDEEYGLSD